MPNKPFTFRITYLPFFIFCFFATTSLLSEELSMEQSCILEQIEKLSKETSVGELKRLCEQQTEIQTSNNSNNHTQSRHSKSAVERLAFTPHKANYILPISYNNSPNSAPYDSNFSETTINKMEVVFQLSSKMLIYENLLGDNGDLYGAYTGRFWWQAYNNDLSSPFREANHEPELFLDFETRYSWGEWNLTNIIYGMVHQSNGRSLPLSRSWNRLYMLFKLENEQAWVHFKPWYRVPEANKHSVDDPEGDDNPDIDDYVGYLELSMGYEFDKHHLSAMVRNNLRSDNKGAIQFDWTFPIWDLTDVRGYIQYFNGYGESMIDYNAVSNRLSIGFIMSEKGQ